MSCADRSNASETKARSVSEIPLMSPLRLAASKVKSIDDLLSNHHIIQIPAKRLEQQCRVHATRPYLGLDDPTYQGWGRVAA